MIECFFFNIREYAEKIDAVVDFLPSPKQIKTIDKMFEHLKIFQGVTMKLQSDNCLDLSDVRSLFDAVIENSTHNASNN